MQDWVIIVITIVSSAIVGYIFPYIVGFGRFVLNLAFGKQLLEGTWHAYHYTWMHGKRVLRYERWEIKRNALNKLVVKTADPKNPDLKYEGIISKERNYLVILLRGVKHEEEVQMRLFDIIPTGQDLAFGLVMGVDFDNQPQAFVRVISRRELANKEAEDLLSSKTMVKDNVTLSIR